MKILPDIILKRFAFLHRLGIELPYPYNDIYNTLFEFFEEARIVNLYDKHNKVNRCALDKNGVIIYCILEEMVIRHSRAVEKTVLKINSHYYYTKTDLQNTYQDINHLEIETISEIILIHKGLKFDIYNISLESGDYYDTHFGYLKNEYSKILTLGYLNA